MSGKAMEQDKNGLGLAGFALAIVGLVLAFIPSLGIGAMILSAIGCIFAVIGIFMIGLGIAGVGTVRSAEATDKPSDSISSQIQQDAVNDDAKIVEITASAPHRGIAEITVGGARTAHQFTTTYTQKITGNAAKKLVTVKVHGDENDPDDQTISCAVAVNGKRVSQQKVKGDNPMVSCSSANAEK